MNKTVLRLSAVALYKDVGYDPVKDFTPIGKVGCTPNVIAVSKAMPVENLKDPYSLHHAFGRLD
jgi:tripartite-type tricarboxylate transporter receptor subunit TctC